MPVHYPDAGVNHGLMDAKTTLPDTSNRPGDESALDNPIWNALQTDHRALALGDAHARRYPHDIGPLSGMPDQSQTSYDSLRKLAGPGGVLALFFQEKPRPPVGWHLVRGGLLSQMIRRETDPGGIAGPQTSPVIRALSSVDVPQMIALAELTEPGPFRSKTIELGSFYGIFDGDKLVAMAGQRMSIPGFIEVSAVCTSPDARGRGYAQALMAVAMHNIQQRGRTPFLHVLSDNHSAIRVYERLGFVIRRNFHLAVLKNEG
jgi:GNAT superfamily N-acetyltransferase